MPEAKTAAPQAKPPKKAAFRSPLEQAEALLEQSEYQKAAEAFEALRRFAPNPADRASAELGLAHTWLITGAYERAASLAAEVASRFSSAGSAPPKAQQAKAALSDAWSRAKWIEASALRSRGRLEEAEGVLSKLPLQGAYELRLLQGEILLEQGKKQQAEAVFMGLVEDYNEDRITETDAKGLLAVGRGAHLLASARDANDAFNQAERVTGIFMQLALFRAELFLEKYDPGHAEEVLQEVLKKAPHHPEANLWLARVRLDQSYDFDEAERLVKKVQAVNPNLAAAYGVLAGVALREARLDGAEAHIAEGLAKNPRDLELLSLRATARYLRDDQEGYEREVQAILKLNPHYSKVYNIIGDYAEWEHRYDELVVMMRRALQIDADNAKARAQLGLNLIRAGQELPGLTALRHAFSQDPYNVRVYNTLDLFEREIPKNYVTVDSPLFRFRYPVAERPVLERYVPRLLGRAYESMRKTYGFVPEGPVGVELYSTRKDFAVRTLGLPETAIQGVCFGRTLATMSLGEEEFNLGMTLWHEVAHVFHIQLSRSRVPRWFTEGLAEYETLVERPEWAREQDADLVELLRQGKLPPLHEMNRAFTRVENLEDVAGAYYASTKAIEFFAEKYGTAVFPKMLRAWGEGHETSKVFEKALGERPEVVDRAFTSWLKAKLARYNDQFLPIRRTGPGVTLLQSTSNAPGDPKNWARLVLLLLREDRDSEANTALDHALAMHPKDAELRFLRARASLRKQKTEEALNTLGGLIREGFDGYDTQMLLAEAFRQQQEWPRTVLALERASEWDPTQAEPLRALVQLAPSVGRAEVELEALRKLVRLDEHNPEAYRRLLERLLLENKIDEGLKVGEAAIYADMAGLETHRLYAEHLLRAGRASEAQFEFETAALCPGDPEKKAEIYARLAEIAPAKDRRRYLELAKQAEPQASKKPGAEVPAEAAP